METKINEVKMLDIKEMYYQWDITILPIPNQPQYRFFLRYKRDFLAYEKTPNFSPDWIDEKIQEAIKSIYSEISTYVTLIAFPSEQKRWQVLDSSMPSKEITILINPTLPEGAKYEDYVGQSFSQFSIKMHVFCNNKDMLDMISDFYDTSYTIDKMDEVNNLWNNLKDTIH